LVAKIGAGRRDEHNSQKEDPYAAMRRGEGGEKVY